jgi:hypothetical protein
VRLVDFLLVVLQVVTPVLLVLSLKRVRANVNSVLLVLFQAKLLWCVQHVRLDGTRPLTARKPVSHALFSMHNPSPGRAAVSTVNKALLLQLKGRVHAPCVLLVSKELSKIVSCVSSVYLVILTHNRVPRVVHSVLLVNIQTHTKLLNVTVASLAHHLLRVPLRAPHAWLDDINPTTKLVTVLVARLVVTRQHLVL